jgi:glutathione S-transferase
MEGVNHKAELRMSLTLYYHPLSSFCWKVLVALYENDLSFERRIINLGDAADRAALEQVWPFAKFPVIRDHERNRDVAETSIIIEYLQRFWAGRTPLIPSDGEEALEVRLWDRIFDNYVQGPMQHIVADRMRNTKLDLTRERATLSTAYRMLDRQLASSPWVSRHGFSMADCAAAPALFYASTLETIPSELTRVREYLDRLVARASFQRVLEEAKPFFEFYPFAGNIPARFR